jgi:DNA polymerase-3 subunit alpha (Gram-positive type)
MMEVYEAFEKILSEDIVSYFKTATWSDVPVYHKTRQTLELKVHVEQALPFDVYRAWKHQLQIALHVAIEAEITADQGTVSLADLDAYVNAAAGRQPVLRPFQYLHPLLENDTVVFNTMEEERYSKMQRAMPKLTEALQTYGITMHMVCQKIEEDDTIEVKEMDLPKTVPMPEKPQPRTSYRREAPTMLPIRDLQAGMTNVCFEGHIFALENRELKSGKLLQELYISDYDDAIVAKRFENKRNSREELEAIQNGQTVRITGRVDDDSFLHCLSVMIDRIEPISASKRMDEAAEKRTELHIHSNFSEMDGVCEIEEFIQTAFDWGMEGLGICDHDVVQAFPFAQNKVDSLLKNHPDRKFKIMYGCEMDMVDEQFKVLYNNDHRLLSEATYVVFDLETTGLSNRLDRIIEFGAVKMKNREEIGRKQMFINPQMPIPAQISALTHIHQTDVEHAKTIEEALPELLEFIGDAVLIAHNATFDVGFMNAACRQCGLPELRNPWIDTLPLAQSLLDLKSYRLGSVCRFYHVPYDGEGAHRADYDAQVLSQCFCHMLNEYPSDASLDVLEHVDSSDSLRKVHPYHIAVYAKNADGLKELYELITASHTDYLAYNRKSVSAKTSGKPRIPRSVLKAAHDNGNLLFGSACQNGEVFELAQTRSAADLEAAVDFYDYIEIQPLECYKNLIDRHTIRSVDDLKQILMFIMDAAKKKGKPVAATGDAHYVDPHEKRIRDIYINAKAIGGLRHPLYIYDAQKRKMTSAPSQHLRTTDEMFKEFDWLEDKEAYQIIVENPKKILEQAETIYPLKKGTYPPKMEGSDQKLRDICFETAHHTYGEELPDLVEKRLNRELDSIIGNGYAVVYYISHLLVKKSNEDGYIVGSRGSVGSSFVATMSGITEVNPLIPHYICPKCHHYEFLEEGTVSSGFDLEDKTCPVCGATMRGDGQDIPFETFLGFEGEKVPDIDLNFSGEYQPVAHNYCKEVFGEEHAFRAGTVGTVAEKTAYGYVKGYEEEMGLEPFSEAKRMDLAKGCEGVKRTTGQHPAGIVIVPDDMDVHDFTPVQYPANNPMSEWKTTHFDFHQIHDNILKFDILGHVDPTAMRMLEDITGIKVTTLPMNDKDTMAIFSSTETLKIDTTRYDQITGAAGLPEFGTPFVRGILEKTRPTTFSELVTISGLSHGTDVWLGNAETLIDNGTCKLSEVIGCRDDIMVDLMGYGLEPKTAFTIMESVRKGRGLKDEWIKEMRAHDVPEWFIDSCLKIKYMFPKAHAVAYVTMAVRIAWFKVHQPLAYYCMFFSIRCDAYDIQTMIAGEEAIRARMTELKTKMSNNTAEKKDNDIYNTLELALEMYCRGYRFSNISIKRSQATDFIIDPDQENSILPPFTSIDGLGANVANSIVKAREEEAFLSKEDVLKRTQLSKSLMQTMDAMGALEDLDDLNQMRLF